MKKVDNLVGTVYLNKYKIIKLLGTGGMNSTVYLAENVNYDEGSTHYLEKFKYVALKFIKRTLDTTADNWAKILDEKVTIGRLMDNPYIVELELCFPSSTTSNSIVFSMEYVDGPSLKSLIRSRGCLSIVEALSIFKKIILGVDYMHDRERAIIHRDLKPENILLSKDLLDVKISDFGVSSVVQNIDDNNYNILSNEADVFGTIPYICPDVISLDKTKPKVTKQFDFHALGIIFYEMIVGEKPLEIENEMDPTVISYFKKYDITPLKKINPKFLNQIENMFLKLTASKPGDIKYRYDDCLEIIADIEKIERVISGKDKEEPLLISTAKRNYQLVSTFKLNDKESFLKPLFKKSIFWIFCSSFLLFFILLIASLIVNFG
ncbi:MAG: serine/threonine protein kinase [Malacoplasma sp.]|nr:serine/threonine protein kinase [Malacoplasma sp.]MDE7099753.1 serine/threonine protein kinase [Malacoplasma sp.]